ncbi:MAG: HAD family hydrolase [Rhabdochlamydiaceae bacterium]
MIKLVIFDANKVLYDIGPMFAYFSEAQSKFLEKHGIKDIENASKLWGGLGKATMLGKMLMKDAHREYLSRLGLPEGLLDEYRAIDKKAFEKAVLTDPDAREALSKLKKSDCKIAVLSDSGRSAVEMDEMFRHIGLSDMFDKIFVSSEIGHKKPDKEAYEEVLRFFNARPEEAVFVGHESDELDGAKALGMKAISYKGDPSDFVVQSLLEIPGIVERLNTG